MKEFDQALQSVREAFDLSEEQAQEMAQTAKDFATACEGEANDVTATHALLSLADVLKAHGNQD